MRIRIIYYSGTGGTHLAAVQFEDQLKQQGADVDLVRLPFGSDPSDPKADLLVLLFPVYAFTAPEPIRRWLKNLAPVSGIPAVVLSVSGGGEISPNTACRHHAIGKLEQKGYQVVYEEMLVMPSNIAMATKAPADRMLLEILPRKVDRIVQDILDNKRKRSHPKGMDRCFAFCGRAEKIGAHFFGKRITVSNTCNGCGWCASSCPSGNITMQNGKPAFGKQCFLCMNCLYGCPVQALTPGIGKFAMIKGGYNLKLISATNEIQTTQRLEQLLPGFIWSGVRKYLKEEDSK